jgi:hypothetical protein
MKPEVRTLDLQASAIANEDYRGISQSYRDLLRTCLARFTLPSPAASISGGSSLFDEGLAGLHQPLVDFAQTAVPQQPSKCPLHDPPTDKYDPTNLFRLNQNAQQLAVMLQQ